MNCERGSRILSAEGPPEKEHLRTKTATRKGLNFQFGGGPKVARGDEAFEAVRRGVVDVRPLVGRLVGLDEVPLGVQDPGPARVVVVPGP
jgi:threonine dehydrogenase-like Zn-dependent dehydrogenase